MKLIVGLGNPGAEYERTRHNVGFCLLDLLGSRWSIEIKQRKHQGLYGSGWYGEEKIVLLKPQKYMNLSGSSVSRALAYYKIGASDLLVVVDDMALPIGQLRLKPRGSAGGHNGLRDIIEKLGQSEFSRLRIGIGGPAYSATDHVLGSFSPCERELIDTALQEATKAVVCWLDEGVEETMTRFNRRAEKGES